MDRKAFSLPLVVVCFAALINVETARGAPQTAKKLCVKGVVVTAEGVGVQGIEVRCVYFRENDFQFPMGSQISNERGRYEFLISSGFEYCIEAGGKKSTFAKSKRFFADGNKDISVEDLVVRPFTESVRGRVLFDGECPAANLAYGYISENCSPVDPLNPPETNSKGEFVIEHLLPDELFSFWVFVDANTYRVWKRLDPNTPSLEFVLCENEYTRLPSDWLRGGFTHMAIAKDLVYAENSRIEFKLRDLDGKMVSLADERFKNKGVIVNITGSWCGGCLLEAPYLVEFYKKYKDKGLEIIGVGFELESNEKPLEAVKSFKERYNINYTFLYGGSANGEHVESVIKGLKCFGGYPTTIYIDRKGKVRHMHGGFWILTEPHKKWQLEQIEDHIKSILSQETGG